MSEQLDDYTHGRVTELSERGNQLIEEGRFEEAVRFFDEAIDLLPEPIERWEAATWLFGAVGDARFLSGDSRGALQPFLDAMKCPNAIGNAFLHLRLGQVQLDLGNEILAADELTRAYMGGGKEIFDSEDPKYFEFLKTRIDEPPSGW